MNELKWRGVRRGSPCPICGKETWCGRSEDGRLAICMRTPNNRPSRNGGYVWEYDPTRLEWVERVSVVATAPVVLAKSADLAPTRSGLTAPRLTHAEIAAEMKQDGSDFWLADEVLILMGAPVMAALYEPFENALQSFGVYMSKKFENQATMAFPMRDASGQLTGIRYRNNRGKKWSLRNGSDGLFWSPRLMAATRHPRKLFIVEGATDTLALAVLGLPVVGRSSCSSGIRQTTELVHRVQPEQVVILSDNDATKSTQAGVEYEPGRDGAFRLAKALGVPASIIFPHPFKDARQMVSKRFSEGATLQAIVDEFNKRADEVPARVFQ